MKISKQKIEIQMGNLCMTYTDLANMSGVSRPCMGKLLNGKAVPRPVTVGKIAKALGVDVTDIIETDAATSDIISVKWDSESMNKVN
jgi:predicted transcriptional regulator